MLKLTFELYPEDGRIKPYGHPYGYIFRGVIMKWLSDIKPELVHKLHEFEEIRPYSINYIIHKKVPKLDFIIVSYDDEIQDALFQDLITSEKNIIHIGQKDYYISQVRFERINIRDLIDQSNPVKSFNLNFIRPIYFNTSKGDYPVRFPIPILLFGNLAKLWNETAKNTSEIDRDNFLNWVNVHVYVSGYKMKSVRTEIGKPKPVVGGLGNVSYRVVKINKHYYKHMLKEMNREYDYKFVNDDYSGNCRWLEILCKLGEYTNVGANRTAGMGVIHYYPGNYLTEKNLL